MTGINLFPHREVARRRRREAFLVSLGLFVLLGLLVAGALFVAVASQTDRQIDRNQALRSQIQRLDTQIKDIATLHQEIARLRARQQAVQDLQSDRNLPVHLLGELVRQLPDGVYLTSLRQEQQVVALQGVSQTNEQVSELLRNLERRSVWFARPELIEVTAAVLPLSQREQRRVANFMVRVRIHKPSDPAVSGPAAGPASAPGRG